MELKKQEGQKNGTRKNRKGFADPSSVRFTKTLSVKFPALFLALTWMCFLLPFPVLSSDPGGPGWQDLGPAQEMAVAENKKVMIFVEAEWCGICRRLEREVFSDPAVLQKLHGSYVPVMIDVDSKTPVVFNGEEFTVRRFAQQHNITAVPTLLFLDEKGKVMAHQTGFIPVERMASLLDFIDSAAFGRQSFEEYLGSQR